MKLSLASILPLAALAIKSVSANMVVQEYTSWSIIGAPDEAMSAEEKAYFQDTFVDTYNLVHGHTEGAQVAAQSFVIESEGDEERRGLRAQSNSQRELGRWGWGGGAFSGTCTLCRRRLEDEEKRDLQEIVPGDSAELHRRFELTMAAILREGPYSYFEEISDVKVDFGATQN